MDNVLQTYTWTSRAAAEPVFGTAWEDFMELCTTYPYGPRTILATV